MFVLSLKKELFKQGCGSGSALKKEAGNGSELGSIWLFEEPEAEAFS